jgi:hypothetical protein
MRVSIRDPQILKSLRPLELAAYLRSSGWHKVSEKSNIWANWVREISSGEEIEVTLPLDPQLGDFALRMSDLLCSIEAVEERPQLEILDDLLESSADVIRVRITNAELADGTVPIEDGSQFFYKAKDLMLAAACAAVSPRAYYPSKKPAQAMDYIRRVRLGQTERGSFVLKIVSRVTPCLSGGNGRLFDMEEPFERLVTQTLSHGLASVRTAAGEAASSGKIESFIGAVDKGVNANLCEAITGMASTSEGDQALEVSFSWSRHRPISSGFPFPNKIILPPDTMPVIREATRYFKETSPREDFEIHGPVVKLERGEGESIGRVTVMAFVDEKPHKVAFELSESDYENAIRAHKDNQSINCFGILIREGKLFRLKDPQDFSVSSED